MKKIITLISLTLFLLTGINLYSQEPPPPDTQGQVQPRKLDSATNTKSNIETNDKKNTTKNTMSGVVRSIPETNKSDADTQKVYGENRDSKFSAIEDDPIIGYTYWLMFFTGLLVFFNILLWLSTKKSANAAKKSADVLAASERAVLHIIVCESNIRELSEKYFIKYEIRNYGKTPAIVKEISHCLTWAKTLPDIPVYTPIKFVLREQMISANDSAEGITCESSESFVKSVEAFNRGESSAWFYGCVAYDDIFGNRHEHRFVWRYDISTKGFRPDYKENKYNKNT